MKYYFTVRYNFAPYFLYRNSDFNIERTLVGGEKARIFWEGDFNVSRIHSSTTSIMPSTVLSTGSSVTSKARCGACPHGGHILVSEMQ